MVNQRTIFLIIIVIIIILFAFLIYTAFTPKDGTLDRLGEKVALLAVFLIAIGIYISYLGYTANTNEQIRSNTLKLIDRASLNIVAKMNANYEKAPDFINSLFYDWMSKPMGEKKTGPNHFPTVNDISISIFGAFEDILSNSVIDQTGFYAWIITFLQYTNSQQLFEIWQPLRVGYSKYTIEFGDLLFRTSQRYKPQNGPELLELGIALCCSKEMQAILSQLGEGESNIESCGADCSTFKSKYNDFGPLPTEISSDIYNSTTIPYNSNPIMHHSME